MISILVKSPTRTPCGRDVEAVAHQVLTDEESLHGSSRKFPHNFTMSADLIVRINEDVDRAIRRVEMGIPEFDVVIPQEGPRSLHLFMTEWMRCDDRFSRLGALILTNTNYIIVADDPPSPVLHDIETLREFGLRANSRSWRYGIAKTIGE